MLKNALKEKLKNGLPAAGSWIAMNDPYGVEVMARAGFDWLLIDQEHCAIGEETLRNILVAVKDGTAVPVVRVKSNQPDYFKTALDLGARGIIVPMIESAADVKKAVAHCRYPPAGRRGLGPIRASDYFLEIDEYIRTANEEILLAGQIESAAGVANLDEILGEGGLDAIYIGPTDLALSMGFHGDPRHPEVQSTIDRIFAAARRYGVPAGTTSATPAQFREYLAKGATFMTIGGDLGFLMHGAREAAKAVRAALAAV